LHAKIACNWQPVAFKLYLSGHQLHVNCTRVAASRRRIPINFLILHVAEFACDWRPLRYNLNATGCQSHAIFAHASSQYKKNLQLLKTRCQNNYLN